MQGVDTMVRIYTAPSCASCRKVKAWLKEHQIPYVEKKHLFNPFKRNRIKRTFRKK